MKLARLYVKPASRLAGPVPGSAGELEAPDGPGQLEEAVDTGWGGAQGQPVIVGPRALVRLQ